MRRRPGMLQLHGKREIWKRVLQAHLQKDAAEIDEGEKAACMWWYIPVFMMLFPARLHALKTISRFRRMPRGRDLGRVQGALELQHNSIGRPT